MSRETPTNRSSVSASPTSPAAGMAARDTLAERRERGACRVHMLAARVDAERVSRQGRSRGGRRRRSPCGSAERRDAFRDVVDMGLHGVVDGIEQLVQRDERGTLDVPVGLFHLACKIDGVGEPGVEEVDHRRAGVVGNVDPGGVQCPRHGVPAFVLEEF